MAGYVERWYAAADAALAHIRTTQAGAIAHAAEQIAARLEAKGAWMIMDTGHLLQHEAITRAGGMVALAPFNYTLAFPAEYPGRTAQSAPETEAMLVSAALDRGPLRRGDVLLINSNSGRTANVIEVALQCAARGIATVGIASRAQMAHCAAAHPSGKKLADAVDVFLDNGGPVGDAAVPVEGNEAMCPLSGLGTAYLFWALHAAVIEQLEARGVRPTIYRSVHTGGEAFMQEQQRQCRERGI